MIEINTRANLQILDNWFKKNGENNSKDNLT